MSTSRPVLAIVAALALFVSACGSDGTSTADSTPTDSTPADSTPAASTDTTGAASTATDATEAARSFPATPGTLALAESALGTILVDGEGNTLYLFVPDGQGDSTCYDTCEEAWPVTGAADGVGEGLDASLLGTTTRTNGEVQVTYNKWPLYYFAGDNAPGDTNGQTLGESWYVLGADGSGIS